MDIKYAYYHSSKGYKIVGGTSDQFLKADGSLESLNTGNFVTIDGVENIKGTKTFSGSTNNSYTGAAVMRNGAPNNIFPTLSFHQPTLYAATISYRGNGFHFKDINGKAYEYVNAFGFQKNGSSDNYVLLGGGGHQPVSDFVTQTWVNNNFFNITPVNYIGSGFNLNTLAQTGFFNAGNGTVDDATDYVNNSGAKAVLHFQAEPSYSAMQIQTHRYQGNIISRNKADGVWSNWIRHWGNNDFTKTEIDQWSVAFKYSLLNRGLTFTSDVDADNIDTATEIMSIHLPNGSGNTNFPFYDYGTFMRMKANAFTTDFAHQHNGDLWFKNWYNPNGAVGAKWRKAWDSINLPNPVTQSDLDHYVTLNTSQDVYSVKEFKSGLGMASGSKFYLKGTGDPAHYMTTFGDDTDGFAVSTGFSVKPYNDIDNYPLANSWFFVNGYNAYVKGYGLWHEGNLKLDHLHQVDFTGQIYNGSDSRPNKTFFDYNWAGTGRAGSVINFTGLNLGYSGELFMQYNGNGTDIGIRSRNGDAAQWNPHKWLWHSDHFTQSNVNAWKNLDTFIKIDPNNGHLGYGGVWPIPSHNHYFNGPIRVTYGIDSESSNGNDLFGGNGNLYNLAHEIVLEDEYIRFKPDDRELPGNYNLYNSKNRIVKLTLPDGGEIIMDEMLRLQEITIMNISKNKATFIVKNKGLKFPIEPRSSAKYYMNETGRIIQESMSVGNCFSY